MAILHSRFDRVYYGMSVEGGGLHSSAHIHQTPNLNHRYTAIQIVDEQWKQQLQLQQQEQ